MSNLDENMNIVKEECNKLITSDKEVINYDETEELQIGLIRLNMQLRKEHRALLYNDVLNNEEMSTDMVRLTHKVEVFGHNMLVIMSSEEINKKYIDELIHLINEIRTYINILNNKNNGKKYKEMNNI